MNMWKRAAAIGMTFGMLISGMPISAYADDMIVEGDSYIVAEDDTEAVTAPESDEVDEGVFEDSVIVEVDESEIEDDLVLGIASEETEVELQAAESAVTSGTCGENLTWILDANGTVTISGTGPMRDYTHYGETSPFMGRSDIVTVVIQDGVTNIVDSAFFNCSNLTNITIPSSVTSIGENVFQLCHKLKHISIPYGVTRIGESAFSECNSLESISIPNSVTTIGDYAFFLCNCLTNVIIPESIVSIGSRAFYGCSSITNITIPNGVKRIEDAAFCDCSGMTTLSIPSSVTSIGTYAINGCSKLKSITIPNSVTIIGDYAFRECSGLTSITIPDSVVSIGEGAFNSCSSLNSIVIPQTVTSIGDGAFGFSDNLTIYGYTGSYAETYARENSIPFVGQRDSLYNRGDDTYSFKNYRDQHAEGHCFGMSITSAGYYNNLLDISDIGGSKDTPLYSFSLTQAVMKPICYYQSIQGSAAYNAIVAGGSFYMSVGDYDITSDWREVVDYVKSHQYDDRGLLQIGYRKEFVGGHAVNFLRYENEGGEDRIYAYDNNFPTIETYFYMDSEGRVWQDPMQTFKGPIDCIALRNVEDYFVCAGDYEPTHALYMEENAAYVQGYPYTYMEVDLPEAEYVMYEIPEEVDTVTIIPKQDNASFIYMSKEYSFGKMTDETYGILNLASVDEGGENSKEDFEIYNEPDDIPSEQITISKKPSIKKPAAAKTNITVKWSHFKHTSKKMKPLWKKIKKVQVQCATDSGFTNIVKTATVGKSKTKAKINGLQKNTVYYVRVRYYDGTGYSNWSKVKKIKTKK